ncbi:uncharacterized protein LOC106653117 [Trichogramma pretiosum]|uniref:uncharacterized protein LOC106653117 n=1 Tax=Trichogramma pretiosum TaxID=7493 RepID=UPI000C719C0C|nr:uncharacterized protein LOC106653117 [Trichogramma pretiosum]
MLADLFDADYFVWDARAIIKLQRYLLDERIEMEDIENNEKLENILLATVETAFFDRNPITPELLDAFKESILGLQVDYLNTVRLYRINYIILKVACVEYLLYPHEDNEEYKKIYSCDEQKVTEVYNKLFDLPKDNIPDNVTVTAAKSFFSYDILVDDNDYLETIRLYLRGIDINSRELKYIKNRSVEFINDIIRVYQQVRSNQPELLTSDYPKCVIS